MQVARPNLSVIERMYLPAVLGGLFITFTHLLRTAFRLLIPRSRKKLDEVKDRSMMDMSATGLVTMQYPEEKWPMPDGYRGAPTLVKDEDDREKCVSCQLCEFVCPPRAIRITPGSLPEEDTNAHVEKGPEEFQIDMLRCIYCGLCEEVCPEEAIWLQKDHPIIVGGAREDMVHNKEKLYELGGVLERPIKKWEGK